MISLGSRCKKETIEVRSEHSYKDTSRINSVNRAKRGVTVHAETHRSKLDQYYGNNSVKTKRSAVDMNDCNST